MVLLTSNECNPSLWFTSRTGDGKAPRRGVPRARRFPCPSRTRRWRGAPVTGPRGILPGVSDDTQGSPQARTGASKRRTRTRPAVGILPPGSQLDGAVRGLLTAAFVAVLLFAVLAFAAFSIPEASGTELGTPSVVKRAKMEYRYGESRYKGSGSHGRTGTGSPGKGNALWSPYTPQFNLSRHPAATVPCGLSRQGLPIGLQIAAGHYKDALVLRAAARYAESNPIKFPVLPETK